MDPNINELINSFTKLPSIGRKSASRIVLGLIKDKTLMSLLSSQLSNVARDIKYCNNCGNISSDSLCEICINEKRKNNILCIIEQIEDLWAIEKSGCFKGVYHVLGGTLSAMKGISPKDLKISNLNKRIESENITEVILATNPTIEGQTTAFYITDLIENKNLKITRLAQGVPLGSELDYLDEGTVKTAFESRLDF
ncbi:MAG: recombination protein RecR [Rickettsiales bacterium]|jgi:recombination protein RecR|nr:recombination protein RecR [Rickettsiales bacterium]